MIFKNRANLLLNVADLLCRIEVAVGQEATYHDIDLRLDTLRITENHGIYNDIMSDDKVDQFLLDDEVGNIDVYEELAAGVWCCERNKALDFAVELGLIEKRKGEHAGFKILPSGVGLAKGMRFAASLLRAFVAEHEVGKGL